MTTEDTQGESDTGDAARHEGNPLAAVSALMDERRRFEQWISALEARRATTPEHVFNRVHADYTGRLEGVIANLTTHTDGLRLEMEALSSRLSGIREERQRAEDERAEAELRAHVGELSGADWETMKGASDAALHEMAARHSDVEKELQQTRELLEAAQRPATPATSHPAEPEPTSEPVAAPAPALVVEAAPVERASSPAERPPEPPRAIEPPSAPALQVPRPSPLRVIHRTPAPGMPAIEQQHQLEDEPVIPPAQPRPAERKSSFDELAFLRNVVDTPSGTIEPAPTDQPDEKARRDSFALRSHDDSNANHTDKAGSSIISTDADQLPTVEGALARSRVEGMVGRDSLVDGAKTLKCSECGAMNYPTEWYCERCGAELASL